MKGYELSVVRSNMESNRNLNFRHLEISEKYGGEIRGEIRRVFEVG